MFAEVEIVTAAYQFCAIGAYFGMLIDAKKYMGTPIYAQDTTPGKMTLRLLITLAILIPIFAFCTLQSQIYNENPFMNKSIVRAFLLIALPFLLLSLMFYGWGNLVFKKCKLTREHPRNPIRYDKTYEYD